MELHLPVVEMFPTLQGEGGQAGTPSVFLRLAGCNLWSGRHADRDRGPGACSRWCDTMFVGGKRVLVPEVVARLQGLVQGWRQPHITITGGEPGLHLRRPPGRALVAALLDLGWQVAVETNGTVLCDLLTDERLHVTVSPKRLLHPGEAGPLAHILLRQGSDLKLVVPQWPITLMQEMATWPFGRVYVQPLDDGCPTKNLKRAIAMAQQLGARVSLQIHKLVGLP